MKAEVVAAVASSITALIALVVSIYQLRRARVEHQLSNLPMLRVSLGTEEGGFLAFGIHNEGNGAAFLENVELRVDDEPVALHMLFTKVFGEGKEFISKRFVHQFPKVIQARTYEEIFRIKETGSGARSDTQLMHEFAVRTGIRISSRPLKVSDQRKLIDVERFARVSDEGVRAG